MRRRRGFGASAGVSVVASAAGVSASAFRARRRRAGFGASSAGVSADAASAGAGFARRRRAGFASSSGSIITLRRRGRFGASSSVALAAAATAAAAAISGESDSVTGLRSVVSTASPSSSSPGATATSSAASGATPSAPFFLRRRVPRRPLPFGKLRSSSRASAAGLRDIRVRAPLMTSPASAVCGIAAASSAAESRRSCWRAAWTSRRALRACAPPDEFTSSPSSRFVSGQRCTAYSSCTSRVMFAQRQIQLLAWSRRPTFFSASAWSTALTPSRLSSRGHDSTKSSARSNASASRDAAISCSARSRSCAFLLRSTAVIRNVRLSSPPWSKWSIARARRQPAGATRAPASAAHWTCSP